MKILENEPMNRYTTFKTGGMAKKFIEVSSADDIIESLKLCSENHETPLIIGNGSNVLISDKGLDETVIHIAKDMNNISVDGERIYAEAGALLSKVASVALEEELTGFEFASGIPGTVGGGTFMNAGAYGGEIKDVCEYVDVIKDGKVERLSVDDMDFGYRHSRAEDENLIIVGLGIKLSKGDKDTIRETMKDLNGRRRDKQPLEYPSAGSTFKRPEGYFAGKLIMDAGLSGYKVGDAMVSPKHCGFVINAGNATSSDIYNLIAQVSSIVEDKFGVKLEPEVRIIGDFEN